MCEECYSDEKMWISNSGIDMDVIYAGWLYGSERRSLISLEPTEMGRPLYEKYGFIELKDEMILNET